jgi:flagellar protein FliL
VPAITSRPLRQPGKFFLPAAGGNLPLTNAALIFSLFAASPAGRRDRIIWTDRIMATKPKTAAKTAETAAAGDEKVKRTLPLKKIIVGAAAVAVLGAGFGAYKFFHVATDRREAAAVVKPAVFVDLPEVLVNLSNTGSDRTQYLKVKVVLELPDQLLMQQIQPVMPRVLDTFQTYLRELRPTDLDGSSGLYRLKEELTRRVNAAIAPNKVSAVLFKEIVVQ